MGTAGAVHIVVHIRAHSNTHSKNSSRPRLVVKVCRPAVVDGVSLVIVAGKRDKAVQDIAHAACQGL